MVKCLRIAFSALCGIVCLLLIALWVRSYWWMDGINGPARGTQMLICQSIRGKPCVMLTPRSNPAQGQRWIFANDPLEKLKPPTFIKEMGKTNLAVGLGWSISSNGFSVVLPHWVFAILAVLPAVVPWIWPERYSLLTLLIGMTIVALALV
jgi:hypothetical protein